MFKRHVEFTTTTFFSSFVSEATPDLIHDKYGQNLPDVVAIFQLPKAAVCSADQKVPECGVHHIIGVEASRGLASEFMTANFAKPVVAFDEKGTGSGIILPFYAR